MERVPEPELMDDAAQAEAYAAADFDAPNAAFVERALGLAGPLGAGTRVVDLGCGPGDIALAIAEARPEWSVEGVDGAEAMLAFARRRIRSNTRFTCGLLPDEPAGSGFQLVLSNSLLHHLPDPAALWSTVRRVGAPGAQVLVADLFRPPNADAVEHLVATYAADAPPVLEKDFRASLFAAFEPGEVEAQLRAAGLADALRVEMISDRHLAVSGRLP